MNTLKSTLQATLALLLLVTMGNALAQADDYDQVFDVSEGGMLTINSDSGPIEVSTWDRDEVRVRIRNADDFDVSLEQVGNDVVVVAESERRGIFGFVRSNIRFDVNVPNVFDLDLGTGGGAIEVGALTGDVRVDTSGGAITIGRVTGNVLADTSGGRIEIDDVEGDVTADTSGGRITIGNVTGDASADTSGGHIEIGDVGGDMVANTSGGKFTVGQG